jgi:hypothetical protein
MSDCTLSGAPVLAASVHLPAHGIWWADVELGAGAALTGAVVLELPGLTLAGTIVSGGPWQGRARYRVAGGAGRCGVSIAAKSYASDLGVKLKTVLRDAAAACGEAFDEATGTVGAQWVREAGPAGRQLALLAPSAWYVGEDGVTRLGARAASTFSGAATVTDRDDAAGWVELAADDVSGLLPGATVEGIVAVDVVHTLRDTKLRTRVWAGHGATSRARGALGRLIEALTAHQRYRGLWSYRVVAQSGERLDLQVERASSGMPDLQRVRVRPGVPGCSADWALGSMVLVAFVDGLPNRPMVVAGDDPDSAGFAPSRLDLVGEDDVIPGATVGTGRALRYGDGHVCAFTGVAVPLTPDLVAPTVSVSRVRP